MNNYRLAILVGLMIWTTNILAIENTHLALMGVEDPLAVEIAPSILPKALDVNKPKDDIRCKDHDVCRQINTNLPLRALPRALSALYSKPNVNSEIINSNVKAFWPVYVFQRRDLDFSEPTYPKGWYQVGLNMKKPIGWMLAKDIIEWKQSLIVSYTHPGIGEERRNSVLMFDSKASLQKIVEAEDRSQQVKSIYKDLESKSTKVSTGIISREPARFVNIDEKFYLLPVIDFEPITMFDDKANYLKIVAATPLSRANAAHPDTLKNRKFAEQASQTETTKGISEESLGLDIKFVMDMTDSMGPYIIHTKKAIAEVTTLTANIDTKIRYGLIGYRDDINTVPELRFVTKNFTSNLVNADEFNKVITKATTAITTNDDHPEEVFAGVKEAITSTWNKNSLKLIVLIGDASSHKIGHPQNTTNLDSQQLRKLADSNKINIIAIHLKPSQFATDHMLAKTQFSQLATNPGSSLPAYIPISADNHQEFEMVIGKLTETLSLIISQIRKGNIDIVNIAPNIHAANVMNKTSKIAQTTTATALVNYLGNIATPPRDITAWVLDRDLLNPRIKSLQVRVLLTKRDLNDLIVTLEAVLEAMRQSRLSSVQFFDALQGVVTQTIKGDKITLVTAQKLAESGLMPSWINSLPYKSKLLEMNNESFAVLSAEKRANLEREIEAKLQFYREINENTDLWTILDERNVNDIDSVYPLNLDALP
ncbi:vWA domain-containing protein [Candidatus Halobeggiatoa sp. HSG11]|nr:vWA domain-containing protein [Candidatus Halobeggiatoa sp. HSG11]